MNIWRTFINGNKAISWLLIAAILGIVILPTHMHLHHTDEASSISHKHTVDLHVIYEQLDQGHHDEVAVIDSISDFRIKQLNDNPLSLFIFIIITLTLAFVSFTIRHRLQNNIHPREYFYKLSPPLRAPPIH
jgi:hypothetical protein